ncbi:GNAT family N-acetyltransferase [Umezawaea endophytica]|uniref:GNAT family N-acetyltransferase n=1 Tax=Umezawaea endophytica TaxID=1654476 RepID=A0A9X2VJM4_9PSEU|nr:GNAT family N-acetyltransferase [Umezawaea endophytica]MCS7477831.1 GNAT family N-acetyltransferase [Umezawaea endophytica]
MKVVFAECAPHYDTHLAPYQVLGFPDEGESAATAFGHGMLPSNREMTRFYLARSVRVDLARYVETKRERYVGRQCGGLRRDFRPRALLDRQDEWVDLCLRYMNGSPQWESRRDGRFEPPDVVARLDMPMTTHVVTLTDTADGTPAALALLYVEAPVAYYAVAFYDERYRSVSIGSHLMSQALAAARDLGLTHVYLGTCYYEGALYKTRFNGMEFFDGVRWSDDREKLHLLLDQQDKLRERHVFEHPPYVTATGPPSAQDATLLLTGVRNSRDHLAPEEER